MAAAQPRCLYEVLGLGCDCSPEALRSAYKRLALQLHPDKAIASGSSQEDATAAFQELLHAYEVLSDPKERAYYDSHRSQILFANQNTNSKSSGFAGGGVDFDIFSLFSTAAFSGFSDAGRGFFKVYGDAFAKIYEQELMFARRLGLAADAIAPAPLMGNIEFPYPQVTAFYNYWLQFSTVLDFCWVDEFNASAGPNRRSRRFMEDENNKLRKKAKREYNDSVRGLAAFAKKRDRRVLDMLVQKSEEERKRKMEEKKKKEEEKMKKMEQARSYVEPEWTKVEEDDDFTAYDEETEDHQKKKGGQMEELYCVACNKKFKSNKQWKNHEQSKKHRDKVSELRTAFEKEDALFEEQNDKEEDVKEAHVDFDYDPPLSEDTDTNDKVDTKFVDAINGLELNDDEEYDGIFDQNPCSDDEVSILESMIFDRKSRGNYIYQKEALFSGVDYIDRNECDMRAVSSVGSEQPNQASRGGCREESASNYSERAAECSSNSSNEHATQNGDTIGKQQKIKKKKGDAKGAGKKDTYSNQKASSKGKKALANPKVQSNSCETCGEYFETRNKLFAHLGDTGHAMLKSQPKRSR